MTDRSFFCLPNEMHTKGKEDKDVFSYDPIRKENYMRVDREYSVSRVYYSVYREREELLSVCLPTFHPLS